MAVIAGGGMGKGVGPAGQAVLEQAARRFGCALKWRDYDWSCERYAKTGRMMPDDAIDQLRDTDAIYLGAFGYPAFPDPVSLCRLLIPIPRTFLQFVNLLPVPLLDLKIPRLISSHSFASRLPSSSFFLSFFFFLFFFFF